MLILDEPTNHLDLESREALEAALQAFKGSVLLVSHDRALLDAVGTRTIAVEDGTLHSYVGGWPEYVRVRAERQEAEVQAKRAKPAEARAAAHGRRPPVEEPEAPRRAPRGRDRGRRGRRSSGWRRSSPTPRSGTTRGRPAKSTRRHEQAKKALQDLYAEWETVAG